jgi:hypothetical protein
MAMPRMMAFGAANFQNEMVLCDSAPGIAPSEKPLPIVRKEFPETWIFDSILDIG